jgi:hypothetical protein
LHKTKSTKDVLDFKLASYLSDAPWPANKDELIDYAIRAGAPLEVVETYSLLKTRRDI